MMCTGSRVGERTENKGDFSPPPACNSRQTNLIVVLMMVI